MKYVYLGIIFLCIVIMSFCVYYFLGGFDPIEIKETNGTTFSVMGKAYKGKFYRSDSLNKIYDEINDMLINQNYEGDFAEVSFLNTGITDEEVDLYLGILFYGDAIQVPAGFTVRDFKSERVLYTRFTNYHQVRPGPETIQAEFYRHARENGLTLKDEFLAVTFKDDNALEVYGFIKD